MIQASNRKLVTSEIGSYILVNIPKVDCGPLNTKKQHVICRYKFVFSYNFFYY